MAKRAKFREVADELRTAIASGAYAPGAQLPGEDALSAEKEISTSSARNALKILRREGLIDIKHGQGAFVRDWKPILRDANRRLSAEQWGSGRSIWSVDLGDAIPTAEIEVSATTEPPEYVVDAFAAGSYLVRDRRYILNGRPIQLATSYLDAELVAGTLIERKNTGEGGTYARLSEIGQKPAWFLEQVRARLPLEAEAERLKIGEDEPVFDIVRQAMTDAGRIVEVNRMILLGEVYVLQYAFPS